MRPTLHRRLAGGGALVLGRNVAATELSGMPACPQGGRVSRGWLFVWGVGLKSGIFGGLFFAFGLMRQKAVVGAYRVDLTRRRGQRYTVGLPKVGRWF